MVLNGGRSVCSSSAKSKTYYRYAVKCMYSAINNSNKSKNINGLINSNSTSSSMVLLIVSASSSILVCAFVSLYKLTDI